MQRSDDVIIIGGGITGCAAAYEIARTGARVRVLEKRTIASMGSGRTLAGVRQSGRDPAELPLAVEAVRRWSQLGDELSADIEYRQHGNLRLAEDEDDVPIIRNIVQQQKEQGLQIHFLDSNEAVRELAPAVSDHINAASFTPSDGHANPDATVRAFADAACRSGASIQENISVSSIAVRNGVVDGVVTDQGTVPADHVVVAAGIESSPLMRNLGLELPIRLGMVPVVQSVPIDPLFKPVFGTAKAHFAARQEVSGRVRFSSGGRPIEVDTAEVTWESMQPTCSRVQETIARAVSIVPALSQVPINSIWGGLIDLTPDGIPVLDRVPDIEGVTVAAGFSGHGFCLGPVSGEIVRDLVLQRPSRFALEPFRWGRFASSEESTEAELLG